MLEPGDAGPHRPQPGCIVSVAYLLTATPCAPVPPGSDGIAAATDNTAAAPLSGPAAVVVSSAPASASSPPAAATSAVPEAAACAEAASPEQGLAYAAISNAPAADGIRLEAGDSGRRMLLEAQSAARFEWGAGGVAPELEALVGEIAGVGGTARCRARPGCAHAWARVLRSLAGCSYTGVRVCALSFTGTAG